MLPLILHVTVKWQAWFTIAFFPMNEAFWKVNSHFFTKGDVHMIDILIHG